MLERQTFQNKDLVEIFNDIATTAVLIRDNTSNEMKEMFRQFDDVSCPEFP